MKKIIYRLLSLMLCGVFGVLISCDVMGNASESIFESYQTSLDSSSSSDSTSHTHSFNLEWKSDDNWHWVECSCGQVAGFERHDFSEWSSNSKKHWKECLCGKTKEEGEHTPAHAIDHDDEYLYCPVCGERDYCTHVMPNAWEISEYYHYKTCEYCGENEAYRHEWEWKTNLVEPTYTTKGVALYECPVCLAQGRREIPTKDNPNSTTYKLKVFSFTGGRGEKWLNALTQRYMQERAGKKFTINGKTYDGVEFELTKEKTIMTSMMNSGNKYDVWFQEQVYYNQLLENGTIFRDMTDVLTSDNPYEPGVTIESKMSDYQKNYYERDGKYYGIPHYAGYIGLAYNKAMFANNNWYFKKGYTAEEFASLECFIDKTNTTKSAGPDGMFGTEDDGLPTTYDEFFALCELISENCNPITWAGKHRQEYLNWFMTAMTANYEGLEQMSLNYSFDGVAKNLISVDENGNITELEDLLINGPENGYELAKQAGKYYALKFMERIIAGEYASSGASDVMYTQVQAQEDFVLSDGTMTTDSAMLIDGCWWQMEADRTFNAFEQNYGFDIRDDFGWLPLPMPTQAGADERAGKLSAGKKGYTLTDTHNSLAFIGKHVEGDLYALCKDFLQFAYTDESLAEFTMITNTPKALNYTMTADQKAQMSDFGRSLMDMQEKADIVYTFSKNTFYQANEVTFSQYRTSYSSKYSKNDASVDIAVDEFRFGISAEQYFTGLYLYQQDLWKNLVR